MALDRNDRAQFDDILERNKLTDVLCSLREHYRDRTEALRREASAKADAFAARHNIVLDLFLEARIEVFAARASIEGLIGEAACAALETEMDLR
jgi:hypothetical protein